MRKRLSKIIVTGGAGFIGSAFVRLAIKAGYKVVVVDKLTYAGDLARLGEVNGKYKFYKTDICDKKQISRIFKEERPEILAHFAAESHVDRSIRDSSAFIATNVVGAQVLMDVSREYGVKRFIHISTDEVYGDIIKGEFKESSAIRASSPYAASKAAADLLAQSYIRTHGFPAIIIRPCNNYGPWQYPEKLIALSILKVLKGEKIPVYARGKNIREWLYVEDCARGVLEILRNGRVGEIYNLGSAQEKQNIEVVKTILSALGAKPDMFKFVKDRPGHDIRYRLDSSKLLNKTGWRPRVRFEDGIRSTVNWCLGHRDWLSGKWEDIIKLYK